MKIANADNDNLYNKKTLKTVCVPTLHNRYVFVYFFQIHWKYITSFLGV